MKNIIDENEKFYFVQEITKFVYTHRKNKSELDSLGFSPPYAKNYGNCASIFFECYIIVQNKSRILYRPVEGNTLKINQGAGGMRPQPRPTYAKELRQLFWLVL